LEIPALEVPALEVPVTRMVEPQSPALALRLWHCRKDDGGQFP
jgi:hypothetical protein